METNMHSWPKGAGLSDMAIATLIQGRYEKRMQSTQVLESELNAIDSWDQDYRLKKAPDAVDEVAFNVRQNRRKEIVQILQGELEPAMRSHHSEQSTMNSLVLKSEQKSLYRLA